MPNSRARIDLAIRKRPFLWTALPMSLGILSGEYLEYKIQYLPGIVIIGILLFLLPLSNIRRFLTLFLLLVGWANYQWHSEIHSLDDLRLVIGHQPRLGTVEGIIHQAPISRAHDSGSLTLFQTQLILNVERVRLHSQWRAATGLMLIKVDQPLPPEIFPGNTVSVTGTIRHPRTPIVRGAFNARRHLRLQGIHYELHLRDWDPNLKVTQRLKTPPIHVRFQAWARQALAQGQPADQATKLVWAMAIGWKTWLTGEIREPFMLTGTLHIFAISGLHITLITGLLVMISRCFGIRRRYAAYLIIPCLWLYTAATGYPASAIRASTISSVILVGWTLGRPPETLNSLGIAFTLLLLAEPLQLFRPGFQLSFTVVFLLIILYPKLNSLIHYFLRDEALRPPQSQHRFRNIAIRLCLKLHAALSVSIAAWLGSLGLIATYFNLITPISILANLILIPLAGLTMASAILALLTAAWLPSITTLASSSAWFWMSAMIHFCDRAATLPGAYVVVPSPSPGQCLLYYAALATWGLSNNRRFSLAIFLLFVGLEIVFWSVDHFNKRQVTKLTLLPIPEGDAIFVDAPGRDSDWMIDGGPAWSASRALMPFLKNQPYSANFTNHILTHGDKNHIEILSQLFTNSVPRRIVTSSMNYRSPYYRELIRKSRNQAHRIDQLTSPDQLGPWTLLHPNPSTPPSPADDAAIVLMGRLHGITILLLSDLDRAVQHELLEHNPTLETDILVLNLPHPTKPPNHFVLKELNPQAILITGADTERGHRWVQDLALGFSEQNTRVFFTGLEGTIEIILTPEHSQISTVSGKTQIIHSRSH